MLLNEIKSLSEAAYKGNLGMMEMFKFYQIASAEQKSIMKKLIDDKLLDRAWELLQQVTGVKLHSSVKEALHEQFMDEADKSFVLVIGGAGSGKNHFIENDPELKTFTLVDVDVMKQDMAVSDAIKNVKPELEKLFSAGVNVVHSATGSNLTAQKNKLALAHAYRYHTKVILIDTPVEQAIKNVERRAAQGGHTVSLEKIKNSNSLAKINFDALSTIADHSIIIPQ